MSVALYIGSSLVALGLRWKGLPRATCLVPAVVSALAVGAALVGPGTSLAVITLGLVSAGLFGASAFHSRGVDSLALDAGIAMTLGGAAAGVLGGVDAAVTMGAPVSATWLGAVVLGAAGFGFVVSGTSERGLFFERAQDEAPGWALVGAAAAFAHTGAEGLIPVATGGADLSVVGSYIVDGTLKSTRLPSVAAWAPALWLGTATAVGAAILLPLARGGNLRAPAAGVAVVWGVGATVLVLAGGAGWVGGLPTADAVAAGTSFAVAASVDAVATVPVGDGAIVPRAGWVGAWVALGSLVALGGVRLFRGTGGGSACGGSAGWQAGYALVAAALLAHSFDVATVSEAAPAMPWLLPGGLAALSAAALGWGNGTRLDGVAAALAAAGLGGWLVVIGVAT